jgi:hypothetical protein
MPVGTTIVLALISILVAFTAKIPSLFGLISPDPQRRMKAFNESYPNWIGNQWQVGILPCRNLRRPASDSPLTPYAPPQPQQVVLRAASALVRKFISWKWNGAV